MYRLKDVTVNGFWGRYVASTTFHPDVNIFIGRNGTGKTNFMNLLQGVLRVDLQLLQSIEFTSITIKLLEQGRSRTINVKRQAPENVPFEIIEFKVGVRNYKLPISARELDRRYRLNPRLADEYKNLKASINELLNISSLSVNREAWSEPPK